MKAPSAASKLVAGASYPAVMAGSFALFAGLAAIPLPVTIASYLAVLVAAGLVALHEFRFPYRAAWRPGFREIGNDALFLCQSALKNDP